MNSRSPIRRDLAAPALLLLLAVVPPAAHAQYKWLDDQGKVVYSDRPPATPRAGVQVMRGGSLMPNVAPAPATSGGTSASGSADTGRAASAGDAPPAPASGAAPPAGANRRPAGTEAGAVPRAAPPVPTYVERDLAFRKRQQERETAERKQAEQSQQAAQLARLCDDRRADLRALESGARLRRIDANGESSFMSEEEIAQRREQLRKLLSTECRSG